MANPFEITAATNTVALDNKREGLATFTVRNVTRRRVKAVGKLQTLPADSPAMQWITIVPPEATGTPATTDVRDFGIDASQQYQIRVAASADAAPGSYAFRLVVADEINPDENYTQSPDVMFTVPPPPVQGKKPLPGWLIPLVVVVILIVLGAIALVIAEQNRQAAAADATATQVEAMRQTADAATLTALAPTETSTATATRTLTPTPTPTPTRHPTATNPPTRRPRPTPTRIIIDDPCLGFPNPLRIPDCDDIEIP